MAKKGLFLIFLISFLLYLPSLTNFYTNDDFFHLKIAKINFFLDFINFFNPISSPLGFGFYRPLTTQVFYSVAYFFNLNPLILHILSFLVFFAICCLIYIFSKKITNNVLQSLAVVFLYATSATHFGHLYFLATFQELGLALFYFLTLIFFISYIKSYKHKYIFLVFISFVLALMSKEFVVTIPLTLLLILCFKDIFGIKKIILKKTLLVMIILFSVLGLYLFLHFFYYGFAKGDSYFWNVSLKAINTILWYILWSLNLPEMLVDYIGPGLRVNPNLLKFYGDKIIPIIILFFSMVVLLFTSFLESLKKNKIKDLKIYLFSMIWFLITLSPVIFLPFHKFSYELTIPLFGVTLFLSNFLIKFKNSKFILFAFLINYLILSILTNIISFETSWITRGSKISEKVLNYTLKNENFTNINQTFLFYDELEDKKLLWLPSSQLKQILSDNNFFDVYFSGRVKAYYGNSNLIIPESRKVRARIFF